MRVLYFSRDYSSHDYRFLTGLAMTGHTIGYLRLEKSAHPQELRQLPPEIGCIPWQGGKDLFNWKHSLGLLNDLKRVLKTFQPDLVLAGPIQRTALLIALTGFQPLVSMSWGYDLLIDAKRNPLWSWATRYTLKHSAALICDCDTTRRLAIDNGMNPNKIVSFPWGIDLDHFKPDQTGEAKFDQSNQAPLTLLSTRSWEPIYGIDVLASGFVKACSQLPDLHLMMLNSGSQQKKIQKILAPIVIVHSQPQNGEVYPNPTVFLTGQIAYHELPKIYRQADMYIAATHSDGTSISMLEAMACAKPVLVSDIPGNREWIENGRNGWLFPDGDAAALASAILNAAENRPKLAEMGRAARQVAEQRANWHQNFPKLMNAFEIALNLPSGALSL
jgi:L-malate glycosyltransferase